MSTPEATDQLMAKLAAQSGQAVQPWPLCRRLCLAALVSLGGVALLAASLLGVRPDFMASLATTRQIFKIGAVLALALGALTLALAAARPERGRPVIQALLPGLVLLLLGAALDPSGSLWGRGPTSPLFCLGAILGLALLPFVLIFITLRHEAPARPGYAGGAAGLLAGLLSALGYTIACRADSGLFVAVWYGLAILLVTLAGTVLGRRLLAW
ncbi:hypothetical protein SAMN07250955_101106 [Arboricoccus pini]|uniref:DUF1109 family protein n=1 Tax=Arboricoccus pini TaxID=1963835 RepID=A0A212PX11_9PROT|nr:NrsF family protein [Arboricoccus pini]SNB51592.1 hypothetical protein SAMN07250955_101106 [Arboricoccus pini]